MIRLPTWLLLLPVLLLALPAHPTEASEYLYYRDVVIPPFKSMREFFDLPDRRGSYEVTVVSDSLGPLTFRVLRVQGEAERLEVRRRSYRIQNHLFQAAFDNRGGKDDLMVVIDNANPLQSARVSLYVIEPPP